METIPRFANILFKLPNGKVVLQRRTKDAPYGAGQLGVFGGWVDEDETVDECLVREIKEETSLNTDELDLTFIADFVMHASKDFDKDRHFYVFTGTVDTLDFEVYEGDGAEAFFLSELTERSDLTAHAKYMFNHVIKAHHLN